MSLPIEIENSVLEFYNTRDEKLINKIYLDSKRLGHNFLLKSEFELTELGIDEASHMGATYFIIDYVRLGVSKGLRWKVFDALRYGYQLWKDEQLWSHYHFDSLNERDEDSLIDPYPRYSILADNSIVILEDGLKKSAEMVISFLDKFHYNSSDELKLIARLAIELVTGNRVFEVLCNEFPTHIKMRAKGLSLIIKELIKSDFSFDGDYYQYL